MEKSIEQYSDEELLAIIRRAENTHIPGSQYQKAQTEFQIRQQNKLIEATKTKKGGVFLAVGGDMKNDGVIHTDEGATVDIAVAGNYSSDKGKIVQGKKLDERPIWKKPEIILSAMGVIIALISIPWLPFWFQRLRNLNSVNNQRIATGTLNIADILAQNDTFGTSLQQQDFLSKYSNSNIYGSGTFADIGKINGGYLVNIIVSQHEVTCIFNNASDTEQGLLLLQKGQSINFSGRFTNYVFAGGGWDIQECKLLN